VNYLTSKTLKRSEGVERLLADLNWFFFHDLFLSM
jgi:hypothetical protein